MDFHNLLLEAVDHYRYKEDLMKQFIFPDTCLDYAFTLHGILKTRLHYPKGISLKSLPCYAFIYITSGTADLHSDNQTYTLESNTTAWINCEHGFELIITDTNKDLDFILVFASGPSMPTYYSHFYNNQGIAIPSHHSPVIPITFNQIYSNAISKSRDSFLIFPKLLCDLVTYLVLDRLIQTHYGQEPEHIIRIISYIQEHYDEKITLDTIADHFAVSKYSLSREFSSYMNQSLIDYLIDYRIEESLKLLQFSDHSISEIASATGFTTVNNFIHQFKKRTDLTPTAYRKQNQIYSSIQRLSDRYEQI